MAPLAGVTKNAVRAVKTVRIDHEGCQEAGWKEEIDRQIFLPVSNRPEGVSSNKSGGLKG